MQTGDKVVVATYEHKHGSDTRVFTSEAGAHRWRTAIALKWWEHELSSIKPKPDNPNEAAAAYWDHMEERDFEHFTIQEADVEE
ncbi:hypothetical protein CCR94_18175 [Rhodoblastus sphagnicola]|uniref:Uncharacterized protein n=1 Tax=Rhodoblastus sphagnicola TaxID=333368 RepID=A0A2S6N0W4_9HYPH|nr:hypothetical protein [Rhodoblastus sphagnicola]MBB4200582.1 hypothetical protein [Rhodoblastus sphagnicola]PPQ28226.1 hypothetical protein CCR94_18175 [Rhodoblastus sphagnicola]